MTRSTMAAFGRSSLLPGVLALAVLAAGCRRDPPPPPEPAEETETEVTDQDADARADSIAEAERRAEEERRREAERRERERRSAAAVEVLRELVFFEYDSSELTSEAESLLREKVDILRASPGVRLRLEGHADERGSTEYNLALGNRRAQSVKEFFTAFGVEPDRLVTLSYGEERPLVDRSDESAWSQNRRVEFVITDGRDEARMPGGDRR